MPDDFHGLLDRLKRVHEQDVALLRHEIDLLTAERVHVQRDLAPEREAPTPPRASPRPSKASSSGEALGGAPVEEAPVTEVASERNASKGSSREVPVDGQRRVSEFWAQGQNDDRDDGVSQHWRRKIKKRDTKRIISFSTENLDTAPPLAKIVNSKAYDMIVIFLVFLNAIFIGVEVQHFAAHYTTFPYRDFIEGVFTAIFTIELMLRMYVNGWEFISQSSPEFAWNIFDMFVVLFMICDTILLHLVATKMDTLSNLSVLRVIRVIRVTRAFRVIRLLKFFRELRLMIASMMTSLKPLMWTMLVLMVLFYIIGIMLTQGTAFHCSDRGDACATSEVRHLQERFGSLDSSILSLFEAMSNGVSWGILFDALRPLSFSYRIVFIVYISFAMFAMVNVVTSVFVDGAVQSSNRDHDNLIQEELRHKEEYIASMHALFLEMDHDGSGFISMEEFKQAIHDERIVAYFHVLGLAIEDVETLFVLLDRDRTGAIDIEEFLLGCMKLKGEAKSLDLAKLTYESEWLVHNMDDLRQHISSLGALIGELHRQRSPCSYPQLPDGKSEQVGNLNLDQASTQEKAACGEPPGLTSQRASL